MGFIAFRNSTGRCKAWTLACTTSQLNDGLGLDLLWMNVQDGAGYVYMSMNEHMDRKIHELAILQATSLCTKAFNGLELKQGDFPQRLLNLHSSHCNVNQIQGWPPSKPHLALACHPWKGRPGRKSKNHSVVAMELVKNYRVLALVALHNVNRE